MTVAVISVPERKQVQIGDIMRKDAPPGHSERSIVTSALPSHPMLYFYYMPLLSGSKKKGMQEESHLSLIQNPYFDLSSSEKGNGTFACATYDQMKRVVTAIRPPLSPLPNGMSVASREMPDSSSSRLKVPVHLETPGAAKFSITMTSTGIAIDYSNKVSFDSFTIQNQSSDFLASLRNGMFAALKSGPVLGYPIAGMKIHISKVWRESVSRGSTSNGQLE